MHEQRLSSRLISLWKIICENKALPSYARFNHQKIDDMWQDCMVLVPLPKAASQQQSTLQLHHIGKRLSTIMGNTQIGARILSKATSFQGAKIIRHVDHMIDHPQPQPLEEDGQFISGNNKVVKYRSCLLPFGTEEEGVTHVLVGLSWREF